MSHSNQAYTPAPKCESDNYCVNRCTWLSDSHFSLNADLYIIVNLVSTPHTLNRSRPSRSQALGYSLIQVAKLDITPGFSSAKPLAALPTIFYKNLVRYRFFQIVVDQTLASASLVMDFHSQSFCDVGKTCPLEETSILNVLLSSEASSSAIKVCEPSYQGV